MAIPLLNEDVEVISKLGDVPGSDDGLSAQELKERFDYAAVIIKKYINNVLIPGIESSVDEDSLLSQIAEELGKKLSIYGGTMYGPVSMNGQSLNGLSYPLTDDAAVPRSYLSDATFYGGLNVDIAQLYTNKDKTLPMYPKTKVRAITDDSGTPLADILGALNAYPVGSIYLSVDSTSPASLFGGTWEQLKDRFLLGAGSTYSNGATGGAATVTLTVSQIPSHDHTLLIGSDTNTGDVSTAQLRPGKEGDTIYEARKAIENTGGGGSHNNMPPYLVVYMWKRVA